ncbi:uncharacterized protein LOC132903735 [Amyelois transitella]|uniref:uncharacterized protein LOC132903735 n=1 Tax=Amyelois transitella TaxID=680683 RepID=UPI00299009E7|nr:uncharacterized protein LOC132903735 [Amyelois transitella]
MTFKTVILCSTILFIKTVSAQYLNYGNIQNGLSTNNYNLASNNLASNIYGTSNLGANNLVSATSGLTGSNIALGNNLASSVVSNNLIGQNFATNNGFNTASNPISTTASLLEGIGASNGGIFSVTSTSPIVPTGLSVFSDNLVIEGPLSVSGQLPFLSSVAIEGTVASNGQGVAGCGCGDGNIGIVNEFNNAGLYGGLGRPGLGRYY